jgi:hypothetical protein
VFSPFFLSLVIDPELVPERNEGGFREEVEGEGGGEEEDVAGVVLEFVAGVEAAAEGLVVEVVEGVNSADGVVGVVVAGVEAAVVEGASSGSSGVNG